MMNQKAHNRKKLTFALFLIVSVFSIGAIAQKPMEAKALAALITEFKEVVSKNAPDQNDAQVIGAKWDKRNDLSGKAKSQVIELLYGDVKSVIKDSGVLYQIYSMFSFYKWIPDDFDPTQTQPIKAATSKPAAVKQLVELTFRMHHYVGIEAQLAELPGTKDIKDEEERIRKERIVSFEEILKLNNKLTADQKAFVRSNYDQLLKIADKITEDAIKKNFPTEQWIKEGLEKSYSANFRLKELNDLVAFFNSDNGRQVLKYVRQTKMEQMIIGNGGKLTITDADKAEHDKFVSTRLGKPLMTAFLKETIAYYDAKENEARSKNPDADGFAVYRPENLNKIFNKFVADNYKK